MHETVILKIYAVIKIKELEMYNFTDCWKGLVIIKFLYENATRFRSCKLTDIKKFRTIMKFRAMNATASCNYYNYLKKSIPTSSSETKPS
jgi:hypothetical protein